MGKKTECNRIACIFYNISIKPATLTRHRLALIAISRPTKGMPSLIELFNNQSAESMNREFLICDSCFWAASSLSFRRADVLDCPQCEKVLSRIPLGPKECFTYSIDSQRGVELAFA